MATQLHISPVFKGLTRPPMFMGITLDYLGATSLVILCIVILANNPAYGVLYVPLHVLGWIACRIDPNIFRVLMKRLSCGQTPNRRLWGCTSYESA